MKTLILLLSLPLLAGCRTATVSQKDSFREQVALHKNIAILPSEVVLTSAYTGLALPYEKMREKLAEEGAYVQKRITASITCDSGLYRVRVQPTAETNRLLAHAGIANEKTRRYPASQLGAALGVDALMFSTLTTSKLTMFSEATGGSSPADPDLSRRTPKATLVIWIVDVRTGVPVWKFTNLSANLLKVDRVSFASFQKALKKSPYGP